MRDLTETVLGYLFWGLVIPIGFVSNIDPGSALFCVLLTLAAVLLFL